MTVKPVKADVKNIVSVLEGDFVTVEEAAEAVLAKTWSLYEKRARFAVVGRVSMHEGDTVADGSEAAVRTLLDVYATANQATDAALSLAVSTDRKHGHEVWVVPCFFGTASALYKQMKDKREDEAMAAKSYFERELARRIKWLQENSGKQLPADMRGVIEMVDPAEIERRAA